MLTLHRFRNTACSQGANHMVECTFSINRMLEVVEHCNNYCIFDLHVFGTRLIPEGMTLLVQLLAAGTLFVLELVSKDETAVAFTILCIVHFGQVGCEFLAVAASYPLKLLWTFRSA